MALAGDKPTSVAASKFAMQRVASSTDLQCNAVLSRTLLDPENGNRSVRVLSLSAQFEHDERAGFPQRFSGLWIVETDSRAAQQLGPVRMYRDDASAELVRVWVTCAPAGGKTWATAASPDDFDLQLHGEAPR